MEILKKDDVGVRLKELRVHKDVTQAMVEKDIKINRSSLARYENGERVPSVNDLIKLAEYYNTTVDYILTGVLFEDKGIHKELGLSGKSIDILSQYNENSNISIPLEFDGYDYKNDFDETNEECISFCGYISDKSQELYNLRSKSRAILETLNIIISQECCTNLLISINQYLNAIEYCENLEDNGQFKKFGGIDNYKSIMKRIALDKIQESIIKLKK